MFSAEGLDVSLILSPSTAETAQGLIDGRADVSFGGPMRVLMHPNKAKLNATKINKNIISNGYFTWTSTKNNDVINMIILTISVFVAPAPTKASTTSNVEIGAAKIS